MVQHAVNIQANGETDAGRSIAGNRPSEDIDARVEKWTRQLRHQVLIQKNGLSKVACFFGKPVCSRQMTEYEGDPTPRPLFLWAI